MVIPLCEGGDGLDHDARWQTLHALPDRIERRLRFLAGQVPIWDGDHTKRDDVLLLVEQLKLLREALPFVPYGFR